jgi:hypothetical protein
MLTFYASSLGLNEEEESAFQNDLQQHRDLISTQFNVPSSSGKGRKEEDRTLGQGR